jgi:hypothetical protein
LFLAFACVVSSPLHFASILHLIQDDLLYRHIVTRHPPAGSHTKVGFARWRFSTRKPVMNTANVTIAGAGHRSSPLPLYARHRILLNIEVSVASPYSYCAISSTNAKPCGTVHQHAGPCPNAKTNSHPFDAQQYKAVVLGVTPLPPRTLFSVVDHHVSAHLA